MRRAKTRAARGRRRGSSRGGKPFWAKLPKKELLDVRLCDLGVKIEGSTLEDRIEQVLEELARRGIGFRPRFWVSEDWFTPHGIPGCAVPFYLCHPRLMRLERSQMLEAEGADRAECLKILRHEVGHAIDCAYRLYLRRKWQSLFGKTSEPYPEMYQPRPFSRSYVQHLDYWYAQAHPDEDFAETFAVWLSPRANWRKAYRGWPAMRKLRYVDELMGEIAGRKPRVRSREHVDPLSRIRKTLRKYYAEKQERYGTDHPDFLDGDLRRLFSDAPEHRGKATAASFLRRIRPEVRRTVSRWTGYSAYALDQVFRDAIGRCRELKLRTVGAPGQTKMDAVIMLTVSIMNYVYRERRWIDL
ncbi:MAG: putative zinc-binding metallopeptidase [Planctomycetota bacterium]